MKIVSMKIDRDSAEEKAEAAMPAENPFPYGLCLRLCEDEMEALGLKEPLPVGTKCAIEARAVVTETRDNESVGGKDVGMSIQIVAMGLEPDKKSAADMLYGKDEEREY
jgi:major coat protein